MARRAVVLMNLGGPDSPSAVRPFLYNLFSDPAIIGLPALLRLPLAWLIAKRRAAVAGEIYAQLGGASPLLANTLAQAEALKAALGEDYRCFVAMRYWHPLTAAAVAAVKAWRADEIILLPLYPQFST
ncbi:MAG TPA: ferrochelatase, partial [Stellaceae bacterium]|nr:ferrochelatase [Stellaceae bacterium]